MQTPEPSPTSLLRREIDKRIRAETRKLKERVKKQTAFTMPNLVGRTLQDAQDLLQSKDSYLMHQVDATGKRREQLDDARWRVCHQTPVAGTKTSVAKIVTVTAVKLDESCPKG